MNLGNKHHTALNAMKGVLFCYTAKSEWNIVIQEGCGQVMTSENEIGRRWG